MTDAPKGFGEQFIQRLQGQGISRGQINKVLALQKLCEDVTALGQQGLLSEAALLEISKVEAPARQKQLAEIAAEHELPVGWIRELARLIKHGETSKTDREANRYWDFFFEAVDLLRREGTGKSVLDRVKGFTVAKDVADASKEREHVDFKQFNLVSGRGLDVGTSNLVGSARKDDGGTVYNIQRNAFLDVRSDTFTKKMLMKLGVDHVVNNDKAYVIGDPAFELANIFEKNTRRPMRDGMISPSEPEALLIERLLITQVLGRPHEPGEVCAYSIPADPIDVERNVVYHSGSIETILRKLGYTPKPVLEGHTVVFAELAADDYTGIGISCGAGMWNICISYKSLPALVFSTSRGGDWIDNNVAHALGLPSSQVCAVKESGVDLNRPRDRVEDAICIYYRNLIHYSLETIRQKFETAQNMPIFRNPISIVCAGGTSMVKGFIDVFRSEFEKINFPLEVKEIRMAQDPLRTVAMGCLEAALEETRVRASGGQPENELNLGRAGITSTASSVGRETRRLLVKPPDPLPPHELRPDAPPPAAPSPESLVETKAAPAPKIEPEAPPEAKVEKAPEPAIEKAPEPEVAPEPGPGAELPEANFEPIEEPEAPAEEKPASDPADDPKDTGAADADEQTAASPGEDKDTDRGDLPLIS